MLMITKNSVVKMQNLVVNHESGPIKLNPEVLVIHWLVLVCFYMRELSYDLLVKYWLNIGLKYWLNIGWISLFLYEGTVI